MKNVYTVQHECEKFETMSLDEKAEYFYQIARKALPFWGVEESCEIKLMNFTENATFEVKPVNQAHFIMRVHRTIYVTYESIQSELYWLEELNKKTDIQVPKPIKTIDGKLVQPIAMPEMDDERYVDCFQFEEGKAPIEITDRRTFCLLGRIIGELHNHSEQLEIPEYFDRIYWDEAGTFCRLNNFYGEMYYESTLLEKEEIDILKKAEEKIEYCLKQYGKRKSNYGVIHSDLRIANLLVDEKEGEPLTKKDIKVLDFDDCGYGWYMYDVASVLGFSEHRKDADEIIEALIEGYQEVRTVTKEDLDMLSTFRLFRTMGLFEAAMFHNERSIGGPGENYDHDSLQYYKNAVEYARNYINA